MPHAGTKMPGPTGNTARVMVSMDSGAPLDNDSFCISRALYLASKSFFPCSVTNFAKQVAIAKVSGPGLIKIWYSG